MPYYPPRASDYFNAIINPEGRVIQRGNMFASGVIQFTFDHWKSVRGGSVAGATFSRGNALLGARQYMRISRNAGDTSVEPIYHAQQISTVDQDYFDGKSVFIGVNVQAGANFSASGGLLTCTVFTGTVTTENLNVATGFATGNTTQTQSLAISTTAQRILFGPFSMPSNAEVYGVVFSYVPSGTAGAADRYDISGVVFGLLTTALEYVPRNLITELALCQQYFEKSFSFLTAPVQNLGVNTQEQVFASSVAGAVLVASPTIPFRVLKNAAPTITLYNPAAANGEMRDETAAADCTATAATNIQRESFRITATGNAATVAGNVMGIHWTANCEIGP